MKKNLHKEQPPFVETAKKALSYKQRLEKAEARSLLIRLTPLTGNDQ